MILLFLRTIPPTVDTQQTQTNLSTERYEKRLVTAHSRELTTEKFTVHNRQYKIVTKCLLQGKRMVLQVPLRQVLLWEFPLCDQQTIMERAREPHHTDGDRTSTSLHQEELGCRVTPRHQRIRCTLIHLQFKMLLPQVSAVPNSLLSCKCMQIILLHNGTHTLRRTHSQRLMTKSSCLSENSIDCIRKRRGFCHLNRNEITA
mmetsp:Transcript_11687/g.43950  ORF Transcript_11687/g.43950 Transcript_11687/m.43950 type:complete len:202 (-) Transcript_11687:2698-3303(-)